MNNESDPRAILRDWITTTSGVLAPGELRDHTPFLELGLITSVDVMELLLLIEELRGAPIDVRALDPATLRSVESICRAFFSSAGGANRRAESA